MAQLGQKVARARVIDTGIFDISVRGSGTNLRCTCQHQLCPALHHGEIFHRQKNNKQAVAVDNGDMSESGRHCGHLLVAKTLQLRILRIPAADDDDRPQIWCHTDTVHCMAAQSWRRADTSHQVSQDKMNMCAEGPR